MAKVYENIAVTLERTDEILKELFAEYQRSLRQKQVSIKAKQLTHDICIQLRSALDRIARRYWNLHIAPQLSENDRNKADIYFPIASKQEGVDSTLGRWRWKAVRETHKPLCDFLISQQPFSAQKNTWLLIIADLANHGKHIDLVPQKRLEDRRITVSAGGGSVSWGPGVIFGSGVSVLGAPIDPRTQRIIPTHGITERIEAWVSFVIDGHGVNAAAFCTEACSETRRIVQEMTDKYGLS